jgi:prepilin-type N-terminal cleavage/methylation domain-containing protein
MRGFTLIEILVTSLIMAVIIGGVLAVLKAADITWNQGQGVLGLQQQARQSLTVMEREIRQSNSNNISITNGGANIEFFIPTDITTSSVTYSQHIKYYLSGSQLIREHPIGTTRVLGNNISSVVFCCWQGAACGTDCSGSTILSISLAAGQTVRGRPLNFPLSGLLTEKVRLRN